MTKEEIRSNVNEIFRDVLEDDQLEIKDKTTSKDVEGWDSLSHIMLIVAVEKRFKIKFLSTEIHSWQNVGEMCEFIKGKIS